MWPWVRVRRLTMCKPPRHFRPTHHVRPTSQSASHQGSNRSALVLHSAWASESEPWTVHDATPAPAARPTFHATIADCASSAATVPPLAQTASRAASTASSLPSPSGSLVVPRRARRMALFMLSHRLPRNPSPSSSLPPHCSHRRLHSTLPRT